MRQFVAQRFGRRLSPCSGLRSLHRLGLVWKRPKRRLLKADPGKRDARIFVVDEAHFRADGEPQGL